jgi:hypothetical protein
VAGKWQDERNQLDMILSPTSERGTSLMAIEAGLTLVALALALFWPQLGTTYFSRIERGFARLARKQSLAVAVVGLTALLLRLAILPLCPIPHPFILDAFSYLLAGDTFASGRLTNPTPAMWTHFETFQISMQPTYMSMYFPAHGLVLAAGQALAGHPWYGVLCVTALMCAAICWMLQAWLPPTWALLGGMLAITHLGLFSYWINTYSGGGSIAALGGALVLGALPRLRKAARTRHMLLLALGVIVLANSRPYEGILLCLPVALALGKWFLLGQDRPPARLLLRRAAVPLLLVIAAGLWMGYYNYRVFENPFTEPYQVNRATYATAPHFIWQLPRPEPVYRHAVMRDFYSGWELSAFTKERTVTGFLTETPLKLVRAVLFFAGIALLPPLFFLRRVLKDRRPRFLVICVVVLALGMLLETWLIPHYLAPFTAAFYVLGLQAMRHLRACRPGSQPVGVGLVRSIVTVCIVLVALRTCAGPLHLRLAGWPTWTWYGSEDFGVARARVQAGFERLTGKQLVIVRYSPTHNPVDEWVYNAADIANSQVIWAREMQAAKNLELIQYYRDRKVWLVQPDKRPAEVSPYPGSGPDTAAVP